MGSSQPVLSDQLAPIQKAVARPKVSGVLGLGLQGGRKRKVSVAALKLWILAIWLTRELRARLWRLAGHFDESVCNIWCKDGAFTACN